MIHPTADVSRGARIGAGTKVWHQAQVCDGAVIGQDCTLGKGVFVDVGVSVGDRCKLQNGAYIYHGNTIEDGVFVGPNVILLNDKNPRAITPDGSVKGAADWTVSTGHVGHGASLGGGAVILPGVHIGRFAMIGSGAVVTHDVPDHGLVIGNPGRLVGFACACGKRLERAADPGGGLYCASCGRLYSTPHPEGWPVVER